MINVRRRNLLIGGSVIVVVLIIIVLYLVLTPSPQLPLQPPLSVPPSTSPSAPDYVPYPEVPSSEEPPLGEATPDTPPSEEPPIPTRKSRGEECEMSNECTDGLICFNGVCQSKKKEGEDCVVDENCYEGAKCYFERTTSQVGKCTNKKISGETCSRRSECVPYIDCKGGSGCTVLVCDGGRCTPVKIALLYGPCTRSEQCYPDGKCLNGKCYPNYALGEACTYDQDCGAYPNTYCHPTLKKCYARPLAI